MNAGSGAPDVLHVGAAARQATAHAKQSALRAQISLASGEPISATADIRKSQTALNARLLMWQRKKAEELEEQQRNPK